MGDSVTKDKKVCVDSTKVNSDTFLLTFYGTTESFVYGTSTDDVLNYIKNGTGGRSGTFDAVLKGGKRKSFLGKTFEKKDGIIGYEFVPGKQ